VSHALHILLEHQYVQLQPSADRIFKCVCGTGMGLIHSGGVASLSFYTRVEKSLLSQPMREEYGILAYYRYHDDIWVATMCNDSLRRMYNQMKSSASYFKLKCTAVSQRQVSFLDVCVYREQYTLSNGHWHSFLQVMPAPPKEVIPLWENSGHHHAVHKAWPKAVIHRAMRLAPENQREFFGNRLLEHYRNCNASDFTLMHMARAITNFGHPGQRRDVQDAVWCILGYHPAWRVSIPRVVAKLQPPAGVSRVRISWRNGNLSFRSKINTHNRVIFGAGNGTSTSFRR